MNTPAKKPRERKPFRTVRVHDPHVQPGIDARLILEIYPNGVIYLREHGRRLRREITAGNIYLRCILRDIAKLPRRSRRS